MHPITVWLLYYTVFIAWHFPGPFQAALRDDAIHAAEHVSFLVTALMFWTIVIEPSGRRRLGYGATSLFIATTAVLSAPPGALLALAQCPLYPAYADGAAAWGITQLEDQQLAGVVTWIPGGCIYLLVAAIVFLKWLEQPAPRSQRPRLMRRAVLTVFVLVLAPLVLGGCDNRDTSADQARFGDAARGRVAIQSFGCGTCHMIPGVLNANGLVGPPLIHFSNRIYIAGMLRNTPENMVTWLRNPQAIVPGNVMPDMGLSARNARDVAAYLFTLQ
jgi:putative membrane protein